MTGLGRGGFSPWPLGTLARREPPPSALPAGPETQAASLRPLRTTTAEPSAMSAELGGPERGATNCVP